MGAVLSQVNEQGKEHPVAYFARTFSKTEKKYCVTRRELLACVKAMKHFHPYLMGAPFTVRTDHSSLVWLCHFKELDGQLARWLETLAQYDFEIVYRKGNKHGNADGLSRRSCKDCKYCEKVEHLEYAVRFVQVAGEWMPYKEVWAAGELDPDGNKGVINFPLDGVDTLSTEGESGGDSGGVDWEDYKEETGNKDSSEEETDSGMVEIVYKEMGEGQSEEWKNRLVVNEDVKLIRDEEEREVMHGTDEKRADVGSRSKESLRKADRLQLVREVVEEQATLRESLGARKDIIIEQQKDLGLRRLTQDKKGNKEQPEVGEIALWSVENKRYWSQWDSLEGERRCVV
jgi:hypothetical protein